MMKRVVHISVSFGMSVLLVGCGVGLGLFPKSSYETLHPKPQITYWEKPGMTDVGRLEDWVACGGFKDGDVGFDTKKHRLPSETDEQTRERLRDSHDRCLMARGYRFTQCADSAYWQRRPRCGAP